MAKLKEIAVTVTFDQEKFTKRYESILIAVEELYDLVPEWKKGLADEAKSKIVEKMIAISVNKFDENG